MKPRLLIKLCCIIVLLTTAMRVRAQTPPPIAVEIIYFTATYEAGQVLVAWETATELDKVGFFVTRSIHLEGSYERISDFIPAEGIGIIGAEYEFVDADIVEGNTFYYILESIDTNQDVSTYGPISVKAGDERIYLPVIAKNFDPSGGLVIGSQNWYIDDYGYFHFIGLVTNTSDRAVENIEIKIEVFDRDGALLDTITANTTLYSLAPGETSPFALWIYEKIPDADHIEAKIIGFERTAIDRETISIVRDQLVVDDYDDLHLTGKLINNTDFPIEIKGLTAASFDDDGNLQTVGDRTVKVRYMDPGDSAPFRIKMTGPKGGSDYLSNCHFYVDAQRATQITKYDFVISNFQNTYVDEYEHFHYVGEITNTYTENLTLSMVAGIYDDAGNVIDAATTDIPTFSIAPGDTLPFDFQYWGPMNYIYGYSDITQTYSIQVDPYWSWVSSSRYIDLPTQNNDYQLNEFSIIFNGEIHNSSGTVVDGATVIVRIYDEDTHNLIATSYGGIYDPIADNATVTYIVWLVMPRDLDIFSVDYEILAKGYLP